MEFSLAERGRRVHPGQKVEVKWFERDGTYSGIGIVNEVTASSVKVVLKKVLSGGSSYKAGHEVKVPRPQEHTGDTFINNVRLIEEKAFKHKDFL